MSRKEKKRAEEKVEIARRCLKGEISVSAAGQEAGVDRETVRQWMARYETEGVEGFLPYKQNRTYSPELKR